MSVMPLGYVRTAGDTTGDSFGETSTDGWAHTQGSARSQGRSQTLKPVRVTMPTAVYSLDEQLHLAIVKLRELPNQAAIVKRRGHQPVRIRPATVKPVLARQAMTDGFVEATRTKSVYISSSAHAETEIANRYASLRGEQPKTQAEAVEVETFWSE